MLCLPLTPTELATGRVSRTPGSGLLIHQDTLVVGQRVFHMDLTTSFSRAKTVLMALTVNTVLVKKGKRLTMGIKLSVLLSGMKFSVVPYLQNP